MTLAVRIDVEVAWRILDRLQAERRGAVAALEAMRLRCWREAIQFAEADLAELDKEIGQLADRLTAEVIRRCPRRPLRERRQD